MTLLSKVAFAQGFYIDFMDQFDNFSLNEYFRENDFTEDFLKGNCWDVPGEINKPRYYVEY